MLSVRILGGLRIFTATGAVDVHGEVQRRLLQSLIVSEGKIISRELLVDEIWDGEPPAKAANALQAHVSRLRRKLCSAEPGYRASRLVSHPRGYSLDLEDIEVDAIEFVHRVKSAETMKQSDPETAAAVLHAALPMWHGPVFGGDAGGQLSKAAATRYEEYRLRAFESLFDYELSRGRHSLILGELQEIHVQNPFRERFCEQLMIALYRCGRQVDALEVYRRTWHLLIDELGIEASPRLRSVEHAILSHDAVLIHDASGAPPKPDDTFSDLISRVEISPVARAPELRRGPPGRALTKR